MQKTQLTKRTGLVLLTGVLGIFIFFRRVILSGGEWIMGDLADGRLIMAIHEHWFRVLQGLESWNNLGFYYPITNTLGYSDTFLLSGFIHVLFRALGMDMYLAFQSSQMVICAAGFAGMFLWLQRYRKLEFKYALYGAFLLLIASPVYMGTRNSHIQLQAVWLVPWIAILMEQAWHDAHHRPKRLLISFSALSILYGLVAYSTFYMAWFTLLFTVIWAICAVMINGWRTTWVKLLTCIKQWPYLVPGGLALGGLLALFLKTYLSVRMEHGGRPLKVAISSLPQPWDFINHSKTSLLWGNIWSYLHDYPSGWQWEFEVGMTLLFTVFVVITAVVIVRQGRKGNPNTSKYAVVTALAFLISLLLILRIWKLSLWTIPYFLLPGADGIRAAFRYSIFLMVPGILILLIGLKGLQRKLPGAAGSALIGLLATFILLEQFQVANITRINRHEELQTLKTLPDPPSDAEAFFAVGEFTWIYPQTVIHYGSIVYGQHWNLPTIGGWSGLIPKNWGLSHPRLPEANQALIAWCLTNDIKGPVYIFDTRTNQWGPAVKTSVALEDLQEIDLTKVSFERFIQIAPEGWSRPEPWGVWTDGKEALLKIPALENASYPVALEMEIESFINQKHPSQLIEIQVNNKTVYSRDFTLNENSSWVSLKLDSPEAHVKFLLKDAVSPKSLGMHDDPRVLGVALKKLLIRPL